MYEMPAPMRRFGVISTAALAARNRRCGRAHVEVAVLMRAMVATLAVATGCGLGWVDGASSTDGLPTAGIGPYARPEADDLTPAREPWLLTETGVDLNDPSALWRDDGGLRVWFTRAVAGGGEHEIWAAELPSASDLPDVASTLALVADAAWEQGAVEAPAVVRDPASPGRLVMYYQGGVDAPAIGRAAWTASATSPASPRRSRKRSHAVKAKSWTGAAVKRWRRRKTVRSCSKPLR